MHPPWRRVAGLDLDGYVWGVNWQVLYPGATLITDSPTARDWAAAICDGRYRSSKADLRFRASTDWQFFCQ